ncbi:hypothetical protein [Nocardioides sp. AX2bis]|uniref:hypothetical protein n=1 Tax=Nocardioides sp. AX2bis TaxID=2653157 RepID=UPI0012F386CA|nr:hypothetical protein [Nocardioides sp. AX2bis]VXB33749.1 DNA polymerase-3 subunit epsilon [Nocardioides sp. AX2bis]
MSTAQQKWHEDSVLAFDLETSGINPRVDRIVTAAIVHATPGQRPTNITWLINPGIDIPDEAAQVHGWTNDRLEQRLGGAQAMRISNKGTAPLPREAALFEIAAQCGMAMQNEFALIVHNATYDLTMLETELGRHDVPTLSSRPNGIRGVVDPFVIEKAFDPWRKVKGGCRGGKVKCGGCGSTDKTLTSLCAHYGVVHTGAHDAAGDALATIRLASKLMVAWPATARLKLQTLHSHQIGWRREQADSLRAYFDKAGIEHDGVDPGWPIHTGLAADLAAGTGTGAVA